MTRRDHLLLCLITQQRHIYKKRGYILNLIICYTSKKLRMYCQQQTPRNPYLVSFNLQQNSKIFVISVFNSYSRKVAQSKYIFETLPSPSRQIFADCTHIHQVLSQIPRDRVLFESKGNIWYATVSIEMLGKSKQIDFPVFQLNSSDEAQSKIESLATDNRRLTVQLNKMTERVEDLQRNLKFAKNKLQKCQEEIDFYESKTKKRQLLETDMNCQTMIPIKALQKPLANPTQYNPIANNQQCQRVTFVAEPSNYLKYFTLDGNKLILKEQYKDFHQVVNRNRLSIERKSSFGVRIIKSCKNNIYFGILRQERKNQKFTCQHQLAIGYKLSGGKFLFENGKQSGEQLKNIPHGQVLNLMIDPLKDQMVWSVEGLFMLRRPLPAIFKEKPVYFFVSMHESGDEIQFV